MDDVGEGAFVLAPKRSGGAFDPMGCRVEDVNRADDVRALVEALPGRWLLITLTVNRAAWLSPESAYQRCNERVREVHRRVSLRGVGLSALELQSKTGDGWPHWHLMIWAPDGRSVEQVKAEVLKAWRVETDAGSLAWEGRVDEDTGERLISRETIGFVDVQETRDRVGAAVYMAKYVVKRWAALPAWMLDSNRQLRKVRLSRGALDVLERLYRHEPRRGARATAMHRRRPARPLVERMAWSGCEHVVLKREGGRLRFVGVLPIPSTDAAWRKMARLGAVPIRLGGPGRLRWSVDGLTLRVLRRQSGRFESARNLELERRRWMIRNAWRAMQGGWGDVLAAVSFVPPGERIEFVDLDSGVSAAP